MIWLITIAAILAFYEGIKHVTRLYAEGLLRYSMLFLLIIDIHAHYYSWWMYVNYFNDDFYLQIFHQTFFSVTEIVSSVIIFSLCSIEYEITNWKLMVTISISIVHLLIGGLDQFVKQLIFMEGKAFQRFRNLGFMIPDILHIVIIFLEYKRTRGLSRYNYILTKNQLVQLTCLVVFQFLIGKYILT